MFLWTTYYRYAERFWGNGMRFYRKLVYLVVLLCFTTVLAQVTTCSAIAQQAMASAQKACATIGRNQACYGYVSLQATPQPGVQNFNFSQEGDLVNVADLASLQLSPYDPVNNTWGIALMKLQADLPDALPGENVTMLLFGDVQIQNAVTPSSSQVLQPMQAFYFRTGIDQTGCENAPGNGLLIQTPKGVGKVQLRANNVDIRLGSTAYLVAQPGQSMNFYVIEGNSTLSYGGKTVDVPAGAESSVPLDADLNASGQPDDPEAYDADAVSDLPIEDLPEDITIADPADEQTIEEANQETILQPTDETIGEQATDQVDELQATDQADESQPTGQAPEQAPDDENGDSGTGG